MASTGRPRLPRSVRSDRQKVGRQLEQLRVDAGLSVRQAAERIGIPYTRLWSIEKGKFPYDRALGNIAGFYGTTPESIIQSATGQLPLDVIATFLRRTQAEEGLTRRFDRRVSEDEKELLESFLSWIRLRKRISRHTATGGSTSLRG